MEYNRRNPYESSLRLVSLMVSNNMGNHSWEQLGVDHIIKLAMFDIISRGNKVKALDRPNTLFVIIPFQWMCSGYLGHPFIKLGFAPVRSLVIPR